MLLGVGNRHEDSYSIRVGGTYDEEMMARTRSRFGRSLSARSLAWGTDLAVRIEASVPLESNGRASRSACGSLPSRRGTLLSGRLRGVGPYSY